MALQKASNTLYDIKKEQNEEHDIVTYICENTDGILDPLDQMTFALNETAIRYGPIIVLKDAP
jgi:6-phosphogluconolactonase (cycloisomerase 2 family)